MIQPFGGKRYEKPCNVTALTYPAMVDYVAYTYTRMGTQALAMATLPGRSYACGGEFRGTPMASER